jgi:hypothetical protein
VIEFAAGALTVVVAASLAVICWVAYDCEEPDPTCQHKHLVARWKCTLCNESFDRQEDAR